MLLSFPDYDTAIGDGDRPRAARRSRIRAGHVMQLLYIANRYEFRRDRTTLAEGAVVVCDRYLASSVAYGEAQGLDAGWLVDDAEASAAAVADACCSNPARSVAARKQRARDRYERDLALLARVRESYWRQAAQPVMGAHRRFAGQRCGDARSRSARSGHDSGCCKRPHLARARRRQRPARRRPASRRSSPHRRPGQ